MNLTKTVLAAAAVTLIGGTASAAVIGFDDITGGGPNSSYTESGFYFEPAGSTGDIKCWGTKCLKEVTQTVGTTMVYSPDEDSIPDDTFELDFFYFSAIGNTTTENNSFTLVAYDSDIDLDDDSTWGDILYSVEFTLGASLGSLTVIDNTDDGVTATASISFAKDIGSEPDDPNVINYNVGYWVDLTGWLGITEAHWFINTADGPTDGQWRLDCIGANESGTGAQSGCDPSVIPLPGGLPLMASALGIIGILTTRRKLTHAA